MTVWSCRRRSGAPAALLLVGPLFLLAGGCGPAPAPGGPTPTALDLVTDTAAGDALTEQLRAQATLAEFPPGSTVLSMTVELPSHGTSEALIWIRRENTTVLQTGRLLDPPESLTTPGTYLSVENHAAKFTYIARIRSFSFVRSESADDLDELSVTMNEQAGEGLIVTRFPFIPNAKLLLFGVGSTPHAMPAFDPIDLGPTPPPPEGLLFVREIP